MEYLGQLVGSKRRECVECERGRYGTTAGLEYSCPDLCPAGRFTDRIGAMTIDDCELCPPGRYGATAGLTSRACTESCPAGRTSNEFGLTAATQCEPCPDGLRAEQCEDPVEP